MLVVFIAGKSLSVEFRAHQQHRRERASKKLHSQFLIFWHCFSCDAVTAVCQWVSELVRRGEIKVQLPHLSEPPITRYPPATNTPCLLSPSLSSLHTQKATRQSETQKGGSAENGCVWFWWVCMSCEPQHLGLPFETASPGCRARHWKSANTWLTHQLSWKHTHTHTGSHTTAF